MPQYVYSFDQPLPKERQAKELLGGKGAGLNEMTGLGIPVPPGFTIATDACVYFRTHSKMPDELRDQVAAGLARTEATLGRKLGQADDPLLVSVRSGARVSMPGMMDTILNLGLTDTTVEGLAKKSGDARFAFDAYRRLLQMYGSVVLDVSHGAFERALRALKEEEGDPVMLDSKLSADALRRLVKTYQAIILEQSGTAFPQDPEQQLWAAVQAVFESWDNVRAVRYRRMQHIPADWGTGCSVQAMVFGNKGETSGSGVAFTRNPSTGKKMLYGEYLANAQGEDVVAGIRTPRPLTAAASSPGREDETLERQSPKVFEEIRDHCSALEKHFADMQDVEFTVEENRVFVLQTRTAKRTAIAAVRIAVAMHEEGMTTKEEALLRVDANSLEQLLHAQLPSPKELLEKGVVAMASGLPASPGAATGQIVFEADDAERLAEAGTPTILVRRETSPEDIHGMKAAEGILTATGGMTSHAAVVARGLGKCCVAGCASLSVDYREQTLSVRKKDGTTITLKAGDIITLDGSHGKVYVGALDVVPAAKVEQFETMMEWADGVRRMRVRANADTPRQARVARNYGAQGIGLCRTEHMFFADDRLQAMRCVVLAKDETVRESWLSKIVPMQHEDFVEIFTAMDGLPVTVRLLDWPLHEFLPKEESDYASVANALAEPVNDVRNRAEGMHEINPMLGHRAVRVAVTTPSIYQAQVRALLSAVAVCRKRGVVVLPEIMIPVVSEPRELVRMRSLVEAVATEMIAEDPDMEIGAKRDGFKVGTMIELPRACILADKMAQEAEFISFGTNDLTQTTFGVSRDDAGRFLPAYIDEGLLPADPFARLDEAGVGVLVKMACDKARTVDPSFSLGVCGEHGGDPDSIDFCEECGLVYVSCSPPRLPIARLACAQAVVRRKHVQ